MDKKLELLSQLFEVAARINLETERACFVDMSGHVDKISIRVNNSKTDFLKQLTKHEIYYKCDYLENDGEKEFIEAAQLALTDLNNILSSKWEKTYTAYCNLIDMACQQTFTSEEAAKKWVRKMKRKYDKVHAIVGYKEDLMKASV